MLSSFITIREYQVEGFRCGIIGVVDYVSDPDKSAVDKALELAEEIAANGEAIPVSISSMLLRTIAHTFNHSTPGIESCKTSHLTCTRVGTRTRFVVVTACHAHF